MRKNLEGCGAVGGQCELDANVGEVVLVWDLRGLVLWAGIGRCRCWELLVLGDAGARIGGNGGLV